MYSSKHEFSSLDTGFLYNTVLAKMLYHIILEYSAYEMITIVVTLIFTVTLQNESNISITDLRVSHV